MIFCLLFLSPLMVKGCPGFTEMVCSPSTVQALPGQDVVLSCRVEPPFDLTPETLEWKHGTNDVHVYRSFGHSSDLQHQRFFNRTSLKQNLKDGNISLTLTNVTKEDEGNYTCCLRKNNQPKCSNVILTVVLQTDKETRDHPGSGLSSGDTTNYVLGGVLGGLGGLVVLGIVGFFYIVRVIKQIFRYILLLLL